MAAEVSALAGGARALAERAREVADTGDFRLACQLVEWAAAADPDDTEVRGARHEVYTARVRAETSLMAKGVYTWAAHESSPPAP